MILVSLLAGPVAATVVSCRPMQVRRILPR
jgi:hypothetical protein